MSTLLNSTRAVIKCTIKKSLCLQLPSVLCPYEPGHQSLTLTHTNHVCLDFFLSKGGFEKSPVCVGVLFRRHTSKLTQEKASPGSAARLLLLGLLGGRSRSSHGCGLGLLGHQHRVDVGKDTARGDGHVAQKLVQLLIVADSQLKVAGHNAALLVVASSIASQLQNFGGEVLQHGSHVYGGTSTHTRCVAALAQEASHTANRERQTCLGRTRRRLLGITSATLSLSFSFANDEMSFSK